jgi:alginate O-acetyltransferase complex protein AlgI
MAIGLGKMIGLDFPENFNYPYISKSIREFWRRWHISLSSWLRDYLFLPIAYSLSRRFKNDKYFSIKTDNILYIIAIFITFIFCGLWHGAAIHFIAWGLYFSLFLIMEQIFWGKILKKLWSPLQYTYTLLVVIFGWVIFKSDSLQYALQYFKRMFSFSGGFEALNSYLKFFTITKESIFITIVAILFTTPAFTHLKLSLETISSNSKILLLGIKSVVLILLFFIFIISLAYMASNTYNPFIYFRF